MSPAPKVRPDVRLENGPMQPVECTGCGAGVLARKSSWDQTTIQWTNEAMEACVERKQSLPPNERPNRNAFMGCGALKESVRVAAVKGQLDIQDEDPLKTNPEGHQ